jgi:hypothetical protein
MGTELHTHYTCERQECMREVIFRCPAPKQGSTGL